MHPIIQITTSSGWGGRESLPLTLHREWISRGSDALLIAGEGTELARRCKGVTHTMTIPTARVSAARALRRVLNAYPEPQGVDIVSHFTRDLGSIRVACIGHPHIRLTVIKHVSPGPPKRDIFHQFLYKRVGLLLAVSEYVRQKCERAYPINPERTGVWQPGVDVNRFHFDAAARARLRREAGTGDNTTVLGYVARLTPNKGLEDLIAATMSLRAAGAPVILWLVGSSSDDERLYEEHLRRMAAECSAAGAIRFWGRREDVEAIYSAVDIFVVPSRAEAFGLTTIEAMACSRPIVGFKIGGTAEIVEDGSTGILTDADSGDHALALMHSIGRMLDIPNPTAMGEKAREVVVARFSCDSMLTRLEQAMHRTQA